MILTLDVDTPEDFVPAIDAYFFVSSQNPGQEVGNGGAVAVQKGDKTFTVVRNDNSYTVRSGDTTGADQEQLQGFPV